MAMEASQTGGSSNSPAPFLTKTYEMVDDPITNCVVSWSHSGCSFVVWNPPEFARDLLPKYFKHNNFSSFIRQLNTYGFRKIDPDQWEFANENFIRGQRHLLKDIHRRKPIHSHSIQNQLPLTETERQEYEEKIKRLNHEKLQLQIKLQRHQAECPELEIQMQSLCERLQNMEHRQRQLMSYLAQLLQKPGFSSMLMQQSEIHNKKRRLVDSSHLYDGYNMEDDKSLTVQRERIANPEQIEKIEASMKVLESFLHEVNETMSEEAANNDFGVSSHQACPVIDSEAHASSEEYDQLYSPTSHIASPQSRDIESSPDLPAMMSSFNLGVDITSDSSRNDDNSNPANAPKVEASNEHAAGEITSAAPNEGNDVFWSQFLNENYTLYQTHEADQIVKREADSKMSDYRPSNYKKYWWNAFGVDNISKHMRHLTPAE